MKTLYVASQNEDTREWTPVARLIGGADGYVLNYTRGAYRLPGFVGFGRMSALDQTYFSKSLFPFFANRLIPKSRSEYSDYMEWLELGALSDDPMSVLGATGGVRATDNFELISPPEPFRGGYGIRFFSRGVRYLNESSLAAISHLERGDTLRIMKDIQNERDANALALTTHSQSIVVGYVPKYYCLGLGRMLAKDASAVRVQVLRVNPAAPIDMRLLCQMELISDEYPDLLEQNDDCAPIVRGDAHAANQAALLGTDLNITGSN